MTFPKATKPYFPEIRVENLNGAPALLPGELPGEKTLVVIAFDQEQQRSVDAWVEGMKLEATNIAWLELPVIEDPGAIGRWLIDNGMRRGIPDRAARGRVFTVYTDRAEFLTAMGIDGAREVVVVVVDRSGQILARQSGGYAATKADALFEVLRKRDPS